MPAETTTTPHQTQSKILQIKITLKGSKPPIWRRVLVPDDLTLARFHTVIQAVLGWTDSHLHEFVIGGRKFGVPDPENDWIGGEKSINEKKAYLYDVLGEAGDKAEYTYDFGDNWEHTVAVEKVLAPEPGVIYPICTAGKRNGPPEDCGGVYGYYNLLQILRDPSHEEYQSMLEWVGGKFDPEDFSVEEIDARLTPLRRRRAKAAKSS